MSVVYVLFFILIFLSFRNEAVVTPSKYSCSNATFALNSTYHANLNHVLYFLFLNSTSESGFYCCSIGKKPIDEVFGNFLCRGDLNTQECKECVVVAADHISNTCPGKKEVIIWYDKCMVRYSNEPIFSKMELKPYLNAVNKENIAQPERFLDSLNNTMNRLASEVVKHYKKSTAAKHFASKEVKHLGKWTYNFVQCSPDISAEECRICLQKAISHLQDCCGGKIGGKVMLPSCFLRFEIYPFYDSIPKGSLRKIVAIVASTVISVLILALVFYWLLTTKLVQKDLNATNEKTVYSEISTIDSLRFSLSTIETATNNFSDDNKLGEGGFGAVYRGMLPNGQEIAAKRLSKSSVQGKEEFMNEVESVTKLQHRNLVRILGICFEGDEMILVYEFVPNKSLDYFLFDAERKGQLDWPNRYKIIVGIVRGILYLHEDSRLRIIHRDLKPSNVLLDGDMNPRISDFGTARIFSVDQIQGSTKRIVGTFGYMSPEYAMYGNFSVKSDVFSFGVLILEIVSGQRNNASISECGDGLLDIAWKHWGTGTPLELMDPSLKESCGIDEATRCIHVGLLCVQEHTEDRPTMSSVVAMLTRDTISLPLPRQPAFTNSCRTDPYILCSTNFTHFTY